MASTRASEQRRVALCIHGLGLGGAQQIIKTLVALGHPNDFRYFVYCCLDGPVRMEVEGAGATVRIIKRHFPKFDPGWTARLARAMKRDGIELVHTHLFGDSLHGYLAARVAGGLPVIMTLHCKPEILNRLQLFGYRWLLARCTRVVACSHSTEHSFVATRWPGTSRMLTIPNGIEAPPEPSTDPDDGRRLRSELGLDTEATVIGCIGRLSKEKGHSYLIRAFAQLARCDAGVRLAIIGEGPRRDKLMRLSRAEGVADRVVFTGFRPDVSRFLPAIDVVVFSSLSEGLPVALLEAMAAARPIVATGLPGILEAVRRDHEALIVPAADVDGLSEGMRRMAGDAALRRDLGQAARQRFLEKFTAQRMIRDYEDLYRETLALR